MSFLYPAEISTRIKASSRDAAITPNATGRAASFLCGVSIKFELEIDAGEGVIKSARYATNGCGFAVAAANVLEETLKDKRLVELNALGTVESAVGSILGRIPGSRQHCIDLCFEALHESLSEFRQKRVDSWVGDDPLICSCFGISEGEIENSIEKGKLSTVEEVGDRCNAGTGCGSCQPLIQEILDGAVADATL